MAQPTEWLVEAKVKAFTTKDTKDHEGNGLKIKPSRNYVSLVVDEFGTLARLGCA